MTTMSPTAPEHAGDLSEAIGRPSPTELVEAAMDLVAHVVRWTTRHWPSHVDVDELTSAGMLGLAQAAQRWEPAVGVPFRAFAAVRIRGAVLDAARSLDPMGRTLRDRHRTLEAARAMLASTLGREPTAAELAQALDISSKEVAETMTRAWRSRAERLDRGGDGSSPGTTEIADERTLSPEAWVQQQHVREQLRAALHRLPERHRLVITALYLDGASAESVARLLNVSPSRISQIHQQALRRLRGLIDGELTTS